MRVRIPSAPLLLYNEIMKELFNDKDFQKSNSNDLLPLECHHCNGEFYQKKQRIKLVRSGNCKDTFQFCSLSCYHKNRCLKKEMNCANCGDTFLRNPNELEASGNAFCSKSCSVSFNNRGMNRSKYPKRNCNHCGEHIHWRKKYCNRECFYKHQWSLKVREIESGKIFANSESMARFYAKRYLLEKHGHRCMVCKRKTWMKKPIPLTCDHIDGNSKNNVISNFRLICANCDRQQPTFGSKNRGKGRKSRRKKY